MGDQDIVAQLRDPNYAGCMQHLRSYDEIDRLFNASADLIESLRHSNDALAELADGYAKQRDTLANENFVKIGALEITNGQLQAEIESLRSELARIAKEREEAMKALEPFAKFKTADGLACGLLRMPDDHPMLFNGLSDEIEFVITIGDLRRAAAIRQMGEMPEHGACVHDWFDCSNAAVPPPAKSCRKCGWTCGGDETHGIYIEWPWLSRHAALEKETRE